MHGACTGSACPSWARAGATRACGSSTRSSQKQAEQRPGAEYIDIWDLYANADGSFDPSLRLGDQVHFTVEGQQLLANTVYEAIEQDWLPAGSEAPGASPAATPSASASSI